LSNNYLYQRKTRGKIEILAAIIQLCSTGQKKKTHIMYKANLSGEQNSYYVQELLQCKLIVREQADDGCSVYRTTQRGREYLIHYYQLMKLTELVQERFIDNAEAANLTTESLVFS
jgi:predicted transcriptional regulator